MSCVETQKNIVFKLLKDLKYYDSGVYDHCLRVAGFSIFLADSMKLDDDVCFELWQSSILHDYGKLFIPKHILFKPSRLDQRERAIVEFHVVFGYEVLKTISNFSDAVLTGILQHHERLDGSGYPYGVKDVSLLGRIIAISDVFDALTHERCYKHQYSKSHAISVINTAERGKFDASIAQWISLENIEDHQDRIDAFFSDFDLTMPPTVS